MAARDSKSKSDGIKADQNNNNKENNENNNNNRNISKLQYEMPPDYEYEVRECICERPHKAFECENCHQYLHGRISERCEVHPTVTFLMDFRQCPYCFKSREQIRESRLSWAQIRKIEDEKLPSDDEEL